MNVSVEKREIVGILKTHFGSYELLEPNPRSGLLNQIRFHVIDDEGFDNYILVHGDYLTYQYIFPVQVEVKFLTQEQPDLTKETID